MKDYLPCYRIPIAYVFSVEMLKDLIFLKKKCMTYVAFGCVSSLQDLFLKSFSPEKITAQQKALEYERLRNKIVKKI